MEDYAQKKRRLSAQMQSARGDVRLAKPTSNLFRERDRGAQERLDVQDFDQVLEVNAKAGWIEAEGRGHWPYVKKAMDESRGTWLLGVRKDRVGVFVSMPGVTPEILYLPEQRQNKKDFLERIIAGQDA